MDRHDYAKLAGWAVETAAQEAQAHSFPECDTEVCIEDETLTAKNLGIYTIVELGGWPVAGLATSA